MTRHPSDGLDSLSGSAGRPLPGATIAKCVVAGLGHVVLLGLAFPPYNLWPLIFICLLPLVWKSRSKTGLSGVSLVSLWFGSVLGWLWIERWLINVTIVGYPIMAMYLALYSPLFALLIGYARTRPVFRVIPLALLAPVFWTGVEVLRGEVIFTGYAWFLLAHPLANVPLLCQSADLLGAYWISFLVAASGGLIADAIDVNCRRGTSGAFRRRVFHVELACVLPTCVFLLVYGSISLEPETHDRQIVRIWALQTNLPQNNKTGWKVEEQVRDFASFLGTTQDAITATLVKPDLVVWPETMVPGLGLNPETINEIRRFERSVGDRLVPGTSFHEDLLRLTDESRVPLIVGATASPDLKLTLGQEGSRRIEVEGTRRYNSAFVYLPNGVGGTQGERRYDKVHLTPFGEIIPYLHLWPSLQQMVLDVGAKGMSFDLSIGSEIHPLNIPLTGGRTLRAGTPICFESTVSSVCRKLVFAESPDAPQKQADLLINLTNDGWFAADPGGRAQHFQIAQFRAIENRVPVVRAANTGISGAIDSAGRVVQFGPNEPTGLQPEQTMGLMKAELTLDPRIPLYSRIGNLFGWSCLVTAVAYAITCFLTRRSNPCNTTDSP